MICSSLSSKGLPSFLLKKVATPTISSFLLTIGRARTFLIFHPVSSTSSFCHIEDQDYTSSVRVGGEYKRREWGESHLKGEVFVCRSVHHVADLDGAKGESQESTTTFSRKQRRELTNPFSATYVGSPLTRAQWSAGGPLEHRHSELLHRFIFVFTTHPGCCASAYLRDDFNLLFVFQQVVDNLVEVNFLNV